MVFLKKYVIILFLLLITGCKSYEIDINHPVGPGESFSFDYQNSNNDYHILYTYDDGSVIKTNINSITYDNNKSNNNIKDMSLKDAIEKGYTTIDKLYSNWDLLDEYSNKKAKLYSGGELYVLECFLNKNIKDIYISTEKDVIKLCNNK